jgi:ATP-binding cassette, subfamily B, beta-glucan exporter
MKFVRVYGRVIATLGRDMKVAVMLTVANLLVAGLQFVDPVLFGRVVEMLSNSATTPPDQLWSQAVHLLGLWAGVGVLGICANIAAALHAERLAHRNRLMAMRRFYEHVLSLPLSFHGDAHSGRLMKLMLQGAEGMFWLWLSFFRDQLSTFVATLVLLPLTLFLNWRLAIALIVLVVVFCVLTTLVIRHTEAGQRRAQSWQVALAGTAQDALANVTVVQSFTRLAAETRLFGDIVENVIKYQFPVLNWWALVNVMTRAASTIAVISIVVIGTILHVRGQASVGEIVSFMGLSTLLIGRLDGAMQFAARLFQEVPGLQEFFAVMDTKSSVPEKPDAKPLVSGPGEVVFEDVTFAYPGGPPVLDGVSFTARPGSTVALVGPTGAGKSTVMAMLQRLWDPVRGRILIDGQDLRDVTLESLRRNIGVVFQESMLLNRSIRDNLMIGKPDATEAELDRACRMADAHEFIIRQPQGYDTVVGERGATLSGGQRQRLSIARALLKDPPILILDEATSALDAATEARVSRALKALMAGRTTFIIAHRLSTVRDADEILMFEGGRIVEQGSFDELLASHGKFAELVATQLAPAAVA